MSTSINAIAVPLCGLLFAARLTAAALPPGWRAEQELGMAAYAAGDYAEAESRLRRALDAAEGPSGLELAAAQSLLAHALHAQTKDEGAEALFQSSLELRERLLAPEDPLVAESLNNLAAFYVANSHHHKAQPLFERSLRIFERHPGLPIAGILNNLALNLKFLNRFRESEEAYRRAIRIAESSSYSEAKTDLAVALSNLAELYRHENRYAEAEPLFQRAIRLDRAILGGEHPDLATPLANLGLLYSNWGRYPQAKGALEEAVRIRRRKLGNHHRTAESLYHLADLYVLTGDPTGAEALYLEAIERKKAAGPWRAHDVYTPINKLAALYASQGRRDRAEALFQEALSVLEQALGQEHPKLIENLAPLAGFYRDSGRPREAELLYRRAVRIAEKRRVDQALTGGAYSRLADFYFDERRLSDAERQYEKAVASYAKAAADASRLPYGRPDTAAKESVHAAGRYGALTRKSLLELGRARRARGLVSEALIFFDAAARSPRDELARAEALNELGGIFFDDERYAEAIDCFERSLSIFEKRLGPGRIEPAVARNNLALSYRAVGGPYAGRQGARRLHRAMSAGKWAAAERLYQEAIVAADRSGGPKSPDAGVFRVNLAELYRAQGRHREAEPLYLRGIAIEEDALGKNHPDVAFSLANLAALYVESSRPQRAIPLLERVLSMREKALGAHHWTAVAAHMLADAYAAVGDSERAERLYRRSLRLERSARPGHKYAFSILNRLGSLYRSAKRYGDSERTFKESLSFLESTVGPENPNIADTLILLSAVYSEQGLHAEARRHRERAAAIYQERLGPDERTAAAYQLMAESCQALGDGAAAESARRRAAALKPQ